MIRSKLSLVPYVNSYRKRDLEMALADKERIGEILCENGSISQAQLKEALEKQKDVQKLPLGQILVDLGYITDEQLTKAYLQSDTPTN